MSESWYFCNIRLCRYTKQRIIQINRILQPIWWGTFKISINVFFFAEYFVHRMIYIIHIYAMYYACTSIIKFQKWSIQSANGFIYLFIVKNLIYNYILYQNLETDIFWKSLHPIHIFLHTSSTHKAAQRHDAVLLLLLLLSLMYLFIQFYSWT